MFSIENKPPPPTQRPSTYTAQLGEGGGGREDPPTKNTQKTLLHAFEGRGGGGTPSPQNTKHASRTPSKATLTHPPRHGDDAAARKDVRGVLSLGEVVLNDRSGYLEQLEMQVNITNQSGRVRVRRGLGGRGESFGREEKTYAPR